MTRSVKSKAVTIFEGPDGGGKSTIAQEYAELTGARYVHHGPYKQVKDGLPRMFVESMLPALLGYQDVVLDRCWISEPIYADAYRNGQDRVGRARSRILDRLALRCGAVVVKCLPPWAHVRACFVDRVADEYLDNEAQLLTVYGDYQHDLNTHLSEVRHDYTKVIGSSLSLVATVLKEDVEYLRAKTPPHPVDVLSSGNLNAKVLVVGDSFAEHKNNDPLYQAPFGSLNGNGCSMWLADGLDAFRISEQALLWVNADQLTSAWAADLPGGLQIVTLGGDAHRTVSDLGLAAEMVPHPQYWKRFESSHVYPLLRLLKELTL